MSKEPSDKLIANFLYLIDNNLDVTEVFKLGLSLNQLPDLLMYVYNNKYCDYVDDTYVINESGKNFIKEIKPNVKISNSAIEPLYEARIPRQSLEEIYIPEFSPNKAM